MVPKRDARVGTRTRDMGQRRAGVCTRACALPAGLSRGRRSGHVAGREMARLLEKLPPGRALEVGSPRWAPRGPGRAGVAGAGPGRAGALPPAPVREAVPAGGAAERCRLSRQAAVPEDSGRTERSAGLEISSLGCAVQPGSPGARVTEAPFSE